MEKWIISLYNSPLWREKLLCLYSDLISYLLCEDAEAFTSFLNLPFVSHILCHWFCTNCGEKKVIIFIILEAFLPTSPWKHHLFYSHLLRLSFSSPITLRLTLTCSSTVILFLSVPFIFLCIFLQSVVSYLFQAILVMKVNFSELKSWLQCC